MKKILSVIILALMLCSVETQAKGSNSSKKGAFIYGFAFSFKDSTVYITDIQELPTARVIGKAKFLYGRDNYSFQLRDYLSEHGMTAPTCITSFATDKKDVEKDYIKFRKRYSPEKGFTVKYLNTSEFKYQPVEIDDEAVAKEEKEQKEAMKAAKLEKKKNKEIRKQEKRDRKHPPVNGQPVAGSNESPQK